MIRIGFFGILVGLMPLIFVASATSADEPAKSEDAPVITIERSGGFVDPAQNPLANYRFTVAKDGVRFQLLEALLLDLLHPLGDGVGVEFALPGCTPAGLMSLPIRPPTRSPSPTREAPI